MEYVLDIAKWRCGSYGPNQLGLGRTQMCNKEGYMCCLGQFALQVAGEKLCGFCPEDVQSRFFDMDSAPYDPAFVWVNEDADEHEKRSRNTSLARCLMTINDNGVTTPQWKIELIRQKLEAEGHTLKVIQTEGDDCDR